MATDRFPTLDAGNTIFDKFIASTIARTATTVATTSKAVANGVAPLDASAHLPIANAVTGAVICLHYNGVAWPASRPTARTDVTVFLDAPAGTAAPAWLLNTDRFETF